MQARQHNSSPALELPLLKAQLTLFLDQKGEPQMQSKYPFMGVSPFTHRPETPPIFPQLLGAASWSHHHSLLSQSRASFGKAISFPCTFPGFLWVCVPSPAFLYPINIL